MTGAPAFPRRRRFKTVGVARRADGFAILLDGRDAETRAGATLCAPSQALADAIAAEWSNCSDRIDPVAMPLTRLALTAIDRGESNRSLWANEILSFAGSDLLCYWAEAPAGLVERQAAIWSPFLTWAERMLGASFAVTAGVIAIEQPQSMLDAVATRLAARDAWRLLGLRRATELTGSAILALALEASAFGPDEVFGAGRLDERFQAERWGEDAEALARDRRIERDFGVIASWFKLLDE